MLNTLDIILAATHIFFTTSINSNFYSIFLVNQMLSMINDRIFKAEVKEV